MQKMSTKFIPPHPDPTKPGSLPPNKEIPIKPSPWDLKSKSWMFVYRDGGQATASESQADTSINPNNAADILQGVLSPGSFHPMEAVHPDALRKLDDGRTPQLSGLGSSLKILVIIRYEDTPVGPYDELIVAPGLFVNPHTGKKNARITNIYVSSDASVWNGRRNWSLSPPPSSLFILIGFSMRFILLTIWLQQISRNIAHVSYLNPAGNGIRLSKFIILKVVLQLLIHQSRSSQPYCRGLRYRISPYRKSRWLVYRSHLWQHPDIHLIIVMVQSLLRLMIQRMAEKILG